MGDSKMNFVGKMAGLDEDRSIVSLEEGHACAETRRVVESRGSSFTAL
jgi:hypothetical protein